MAPTRLLMVRHGHTAGNERGQEVQMVGRTDVPLTERGLVQAQRLAELLLAVRFTVVYTSPLQRALRTAERIAELSGAPLRVVPDLQEIDCGEADGLTIREVQAQFPIAWARNQLQKEDTFRWPGGESYRQLRNRVLRTVRRIAAAHGGETVVLVTHAGVVSQVMGWIHGIPAARWEPYRPGNCSVTEVSWSQEGGMVRRFDVELVAV